MNFDDIVKWLADNGFRRVSLDGPNRQIFMNEDKSITVGVTEHEKEVMTAKDEEVVKKRLKELGYL
jgi:hypothetical protein